MKEKILVIHSKRFPTSFQQKSSPDFDLVFFSDYSFDVSAVECAKRIAEKYPDVSGVVSFGDETSILASLVALRFNLSGPSPHSIYHAQNKAYFARIAASVSDVYPNTTVFSMKNPPKSFSYPAYLRSSRSAHSDSSGKVLSYKDVQNILSKKRSIIANIEWFHDFYELFAPKTEYDNVFLLQEYVSGKQFTADGYVMDGKATVYAITESIFDENHESFVRFDFPAIKNTDKLFERVSAVAQKIVDALVFDDSFFNFEFFVTEDKQIVLIEFNTRISYQFVPMYTALFETDILEQVCKLSVGKQPRFGKPSNRCASVCIFRKKNDCVFTHVPTEKELLDVVEKDEPIVSVKIFGESGRTLSSYPQDPYTFRYAEVTVVSDNFSKNSKIAAKALGDISLELQSIA